MFRGFAFGRLAAASSSLSSFAPSASPYTLAQRTATKKAGGTVVNKADSPGQRLGVKTFGGERVWEQNILIRQRGLKWHPGLNVYRGKDYTLHAKINGYVHFFKMAIPGKTVGRYRTFINVLPEREGPACEESLVTFAAQVKKQKLDALEYRRGQDNFLAEMRKIYGPGVSREEYIVDKGQQRILSRATEQP
jgi:large subunit ribosomal protein L27